MTKINKIKQLRQETGISITECRKALEQAKNNIDQAKEILKSWGKDLSRKRAGKTVEQGIIEIYVHPNKKIGAIVELRCETDFVAKSKEFQKLAHEICLQIAAMNPLYIKPEDMPEGFLAGETKIYKEQFSKTGKPQKVIDQIIAGKLEKYKQETSLLFQPWIKDETKTIKELIDEYIVKLGENIVVKKFARYEI